MTDAMILPTERFNQAQAIRQIALSLVLNAIVPFAVYRTLQGEFAEGSIMPLLAATLVPAVVIAVGFAVRRSLDAIAAIALGSLLITLVVTIVAADVRFALIARALQGTLTGAFFLSTLLIRRPLLGLIARQFVSVASPYVREKFEMADARDRGRTFHRLTLWWGLLIVGRSLVNLWMAQTLDPATYLLASPILGIGTTAIMVIFTIHYATRRLTRLAKDAAAEASAP